MVFSFIQNITTWLTSTIHSQNTSSEFLWQLLNSSTLVAQTITDPDLMGQMQKVFHNFIATGQVWALLVGFVVGYMLRGMTSYG